MWEHLIAWYLTISLMLGCFWLVLFLQDTTASKTDWICWTVVLFAPLFWPIVLPISSWELTSKALRNMY